MRPRKLAKKYAGLAAITLALGLAGKSGYMVYNSLKQEYTNYVQNVDVSSSEKERRSQNVGTNIMMVALGLLLLGAAVGYEHDSRYRMNGRDPLNLLSESD